MNNFKDEPSEQEKFVYWLSLNFYPWNMENVWMRKEDGCAFNYQELLELYDEYNANRIDENLQIALSIQFNTYKTNGIDPTHQRYYVLERMGDEMHLKHIPYNLLHNYESVESGYEAIKAVPEVRKK